MINLKYDFAVFGATGMQGKIASKDLLANGYSVLLCGRDKGRVEDLLKKHKNKTGFEYIDAENPILMEKVLKRNGIDVVVNCIEGDWNLEVLAACVKAGANCVDLDTNIPKTKKQFAMDGLMKRKNLISITGCGSVPGIGNVMLRYAAPKFDSFHTIKCGYDWKSNMNKFVVPFSILTITEEFLSPASVLRHGKIKKIKNPMDTLKMCYPRGIGKQKCFDDEHQETYTFPHYYKNKGLKNVECSAGFPKHSFDRIKTLIELGMASKEPIDFKGVKIRPIDFLTQVLKRIKFPKGYKETENLWVHIYGEKDGKKKEIRMECIIRTLKGWEEDYTNIDTGMPISIMAQMIKKGIVKEKGAFSPEGVIPTEYFFNELAKRKMRVYENGKQIN